MSYKEALEAAGAVAEVEVTIDVSALLCDVAQLLDGWKQTSPKDWSEWDQSVRDRITLFLQTRPTQRDLAKIVEI